MNNERLNRMDRARHLLPEPGPIVVGELIEELRKAQSHLETAWGVIANAGVSFGDWKSMPPEWQEAAAKWRDEWLKMFRTEPTDSDLLVEVWECRACGKCTPCRVEIKFKEDKILSEYLRGEQRFRRMECLCNAFENPKVLWERVPNVSGEGRKV